MAALPVRSEGTHARAPARVAAWRWQLGVIVLVCCPLAYTLWQLATVPVTNPSQLLQRSLGLWALRLLLITLAITPLVRWTRWYRLVPLRRTLGLASFAYACAHLGVYLWLDMGFELRDLAFDVAKRPFIVVGALVFLCLFPLAATSTMAAQRALGARRWKALHRLVYVAVLLAATHYVLATKVALTAPLLHGIAALVLLGLRWRPRRSTPVTGSMPAVSKTSEHRFRLLAAEKGHIREDLRRARNRTGRAGIPGVAHDRRPRPPS